MPFFVLLVLLCCTFAGCLVLVVFTAPLVYLVALVLLTLVLLTLVLEPSLTPVLVLELLTVVDSREIPPLPDCADPDRLLYLGLELMVPLAPP